MVEINAKVTRVYRRNAASKARYVLNQGGARSTKSYSIAQLFIRRLFEEPNKKFLISRKTYPALWLTSYKLIVELLEKYHLYDKIVEDKTHHLITNPANGSYFCFLSVDDPERIKSTEWNYIWLEESNEFTWDDWIIFQTRLSGPTDADHPNQIFLSFNPSEEQGWVNQRLMLTEIFAKRMEIIHSTYWDNPFLDAEYKNILESLKDQDINSYNVYAKGEWGTLTNIIYVPYTIIPAWPDHVDETIYGLDFGFNHESALLEIGVKDKYNVYLREQLYKTKLTNNDLLDQLKVLIPNENKRCRIYADCAEPARIEEIHRAGFKIYPSDKAVHTGIVFCKQYKYFSLASNVNLNKERGSYKWQKDKNGNVLEDPVKFLDHLMDAKRYALYTHFKGDKKRPGIW